MTMEEITVTKVCAFLMLIIAVIASVHPKFEKDKNLTFQILVIIWLMLIYEKL